jgi:hypothetical protein
MSRSALTESDFRRFRQELTRRAHETAQRIAEKVKNVLADQKEKPDRRSENTPPSSRSGKI